MVGSLLQRIASLVLPCSFAPHAERCAMHHGALAMVDEHGNPWCVYRAAARDIYDELGAADE